MTNITVLCANRPRLLKQALDSIGDLSDATVMIRDAGMNEEVAQVLFEWCSENGAWSFLPEPGELMGTGPARNDVVARSEREFGRGDYLYLSDDDVYFLRPDWLKVLIEAYELAKVDDGQYKVIAAYNHPFNRPIAPSFKYPRRVVDLDGAVRDGVDMNTSDLRYRLGFVDPVYAVATQSMLMSWDVWEEFGPFCQTPAGKVCQSEDVDFCNRIRAAGYKVGAISPALLVNTGITNSFGEKIPGWELVKSQCPEGVICE